MDNLQFMKTFEDIKKMRIGERIQLRREELGLTLKEMAATMKINAIELAAYEYGALEIYPDTMIKLCQTLRTTPDYLCEDLEGIKVQDVLVSF